MNSENRKDNYAYEKDLIKSGYEETIHVTPEQPLIINYTPASYNDVIIDGGEIKTTVKAEVTLKKLTKK
jgi:hypothetical protein